MFPRHQPSAARQVLGHGFWISWEQWLLGNMTAHLVITPAILCWVLGARDFVLTRSRRRWIEGALLVVGSIVANYMAFFGTGGANDGFADVRFFAPVPFLFWAAIRFGMFGASGAIVAIAIFSVDAALTGQGPFTGQSATETVRSLQNFLLSRAAPLYLVAVSVQRMKDVERGLRESESLKSSILSSALDAIITMDEHGKIVEFNPAAVNMFGFERADVVGKSMADLIIPPSLRERHRQGLEHYLATGENGVLGGRIETRAIRCDGGEFPVEVSVTRVDRDGALHFTGYIRDLTERKRAEIEALLHRRELADVSRVATIGELTASVAHELKQPLAAILRNAEAAELLLNADPPAVDEVLEILADIRSDDESAAQIIAEMRTYLQKRDVQNSAVDVNGMVANVLKLASAEAMARRIALQFDPSEGLAPVSGERIHLQQVVLNLVLNGLESMDDESGAEKRLLVRTAHGERGTVSITVTDGGPGIPPDKIATLFEPFFTTKADGLGMGLAIVRTIVRAHGGRVWAENNADRGATFHVALPALDMEADFTGTAATGVQNAEA